jgi:hypothetical protein
MSRIVVKGINNADTASHHAEGLVDPKVLAQKKVTDFGFQNVTFTSQNLAKIVKN